MRWFNNLKMSWQFITGFMVITVFAFVVGAIGILNMAKMQSQDEHMYRQALVLEYAGSAAVNFQQYSYDALKLTTMTSQIDIKNALLQMSQYRIGSNDSLKSLKSIDSSDIVLRIDQSWQDYQSKMDVVTELINAGDLDSAKSDISNGVYMTGTNLRNDYNDLLKQAADQIQSRYDVNKSQSASAEYVTIAVLLAGIAVSLTLGVIISRAIARPLTKMAQVAEQLSCGNISIDGTMTSKELELRSRTNEVGRLFNAFLRLIDGTKLQVEALRVVADGNLTREITVRSGEDVLNRSLHALTLKLKELIISIADAAEQVTADAAVVSDFSSALSQGVSEQANTVEQLTAALSEVASQTHLNEQYAQDVNALAQKARVNAERGNGHMREMLKAMDDIDDSAGKIKKISKVIDDLAFQTNILALNAAVEAARAGQHGKGFAVVADEVRSLANRSAKAVQDTSGLIENALVKVETGIKIANETADYLNQILSQVGDVAGIVDSISSYTREQKQSIAQINQGIRQVSHVVQDNAATSENSASASIELSQQAALLKDLVSFFKVHDAPEPPEDGEEATPEDVLLISPRQHSST
ncbi:methyl-accepting chemotaxis protein [Sporobacter termitidis DSM 10068]|uniref:Methyl-accepting chemotaxis protein n=1 Tax=Sporobacter termitidis DSM 10068 TaxID=1123282 RepID=A0A1M5YGS3_9FIRM|nr:methyl-accepting chemotaxis protein [Sporobacter termitidis]SHI11109.1 methyl-accepting chemotaxis protein [Sporobacter termitidis DSM 10068]